MLAVEARTSLGDLGLDVSLEVDAGSCLALAGPSGAGKSSILRVVSGLLAPAYGRVECDGETWLDTEAGVCLAPERRRVGHLFQDYALFPHLSAWRNVAYGMTGTPRGERQGRAHELLDRFGMASHAEDRPLTLSGGERQRVALARALGRSPRALLLDEPLSALDARTRASASRALAALLRDAGVPSLLVTHDFQEAALLGDRVAVLDAGRIVQQGSAAELASTPASSFVADLTGATVLVGDAVPAEGATTLVRLDGGGTVHSTDPGQGAVAVVVHPWEVSIEPAAGAGAGSARNRLAATVASVTPAGSRLRVGLLVPQPLAVEVTAAAAEGLALEPGRRVVAVFKATAARLVTR